jgi:two-component system, NtrC family, response regulator HupR/HoxA
LENEVRRLVTLAAAGRVTADLLSPQVAARVGDDPAPARAAHTTLAEALAEVKRRVIGDALTRHQGNLSRVAGELGVSRFGLRKMLVQLRLGGGN